MRAAFALLAVVWLTGAARSEEPDLEAMVAKLPVLSAASNDLKSFSLSGRAQLQEGLLVNFDVAWESPNEAAALMTVGGDDPAPVMFNSQGRMLVLDYVRGAVCKNVPSRSDFAVILAANSSFFPL